MSLPNDIVILDKTHRDFPDFQVLHDPPERLYCLGDVSLLKTNCIAVVGTRRMTRYGRDVTETLTADCVRNGLTVVSGMARGVDTVAHETALAKGGGTVAVLGSGFDHIYPAENADLFRRIAEKGLVLTEYEPGMPPLKHQFPARNRIIAALSLGVLVTEAGEKSGALITAYDALDQGREVFAVPGGIFSPESAGTNRLIRAGHAHMVTSGADIFRALGQDYVKNEKITALQLDIEQEKVLNIVCKDGPLHLNGLIEKTGIELQRLNSLLFTMELSGVIEKLPGNFYQAAVTNK
ncbi:DNA polymerase [Clostridia bacterium]|nr:DNA polymerase [Clostridia bacterium]